MSRQFNELVASIVRALPAPDEIVPHLAQVLIDGPSELRAKFDAALARAVREIFIPVITVTGTEELQFPDWIDRVDERCLRRDAAPGAAEEHGEGMVSNVVGVRALGADVEALGDTDRKSVV